MLQKNELGNQLVHQKENTYFALTLVFSLLTYAALLFSIIGIMLIGAIICFSYFVHALSMASIRRNGVRLSEQQFPVIYEKAEKLARKMGLEKMPSMYVMESSGFLNAFATRFFRKDMVVVYSEIFDMSEEGREDELLFVLAHEFAHLKRRHVAVHFLLLPAMFVPFLGEAYLRACEYTCDRYAAYYVGNFEAAKEALVMLAIGKQLSSKVNQEAFVEQINEESGFFAWLSEKLSSHPDLPKRINALDHWIHPEQYPLISGSKKGIIIGLIVSIGLFLLIIGVSAALLVGSSTVASLLEEDYLFEDEAMLDAPPLSQAAMDNDLDMIQQLISEGVDVEEKDHEGLTPLQQAIAWGNYEAAELLLQNGADANAVDEWDTTALINAVLYAAEPEMIELLLEHGADPSIEDSDGYTAYDYAVEYNDQHLIELLTE